MSRETVGDEVRSGDLTVEGTVDATTILIGGAPLDALPSQSGESGKYLTTDGSTASWAEVAAGATGGGTDQVFYENDTSVSADYTITTDKNAGTFGPVTIDSGVTVTVPSGSVWTVV